MSQWQLRVHKHGKVSEVKKCTENLRGTNDFPRVRDCRGGKRKRDTNAKEEVHTHTVVANHEDDARKEDSALGGYAVVVFVD